MVLIDTRTSRVLFTALLFALGLGFLYVIRGTLIVFCSQFFAYLMEPAVSRLERALRGRDAPSHSFTCCFGWSSFVLCLGGTANWSRGSAFRQSTRPSQPVSSG
jgi:predicted PurR-regulated permease PerM